MPYDNNTPLANQRISATQQPIHDNFVAIETVLGANHVTFTGAVADQGKHNMSVYVFGGNPAPFNANEVGLYCRTTTGLAELYFRRGAAANGWPITYDQYTAHGNSFFYTPSGYLVKMGRISTAANGQGGANLNGFGPNFNAEAAVFLTPLTNVGFTNVAGVTGVGGYALTIYATSNGAAASISVNWMAIGPTTP